MRAAVLVALMWAAPPALSGCPRPAQAPHLDAEPAEGAAYGPEGPEAEAPEEAGLFRLSFSFPDELNGWAQWDARGETLPDTSFVLARVHDRPREGAPVRGTVRAVTRRRSYPEPYPEDARPQFYLDYALEYHPGGAAVPVVWVEQLGDWGYGVNTFVNGRAGAWARLPADPFGDGAWVRVSRDGAGLAGELEAAEGHLVDFEPGAGADRTGAAVPGGTYLVTRADSAVVEVRQEVPSDFVAQCRDDAPPDPPASTVLRFRMATPDLFDGGGRPRLSVAYPRGC
jgi:hypothetical protein